MTARTAFLVALWYGVAATAVAAEPRVQTAAANPASPVATAAGTPVETLYADAVAKETAVHKALEAPDAGRAVLKAVRTVVGDFEAIVRQYPTSGFCDDALWRASRVSADAFEKFGEPRDQSAAIRLLQALMSQYPTSRFSRQAPAQLAALAGTAAGPRRRNDARTETVVRASPPAPSPERPAAPERPETVANATPPGPLATIKGIRRSVLPDSVRIIIDLDGEVPFHDERLTNPSRVFVDLLSTRANPALIDQTIRFESDADVVRQIRVGRHPNQTTRIVLDADGVTSYSVYPLYSPYRLVIDCLRAGRSAAAVVRAGEPIGPPLAEPALLPNPAPTIVPAARSTASVATGPSTVPSTTTASSRPAWAKPPVLAARRLPEWSHLPPALGPLTSFVLPELAVPGSAAAVATAPARLPTTRAPGQAEPTPSPATAVPPSRNLKGGFSIARQLGLGVSRIVIDPGHGGYDSGATGADVSEAALVLDIALRVEKLLAKVQGIEVVLTRRGDQYVSLQERTAIANRESADLFLSIHANASPNPQARGVETYFLNFATNLSAASVAARENAASGQSMGTLPDVVKTIALNNKLDESRDFATYVQRGLVDRLKTSNAGVKDLGVKQAPFVVLIGAAMPSVLAEISFLTNPQEAKLLKGQPYRQKIAEALFDAVRKYQAALKSLPRIAEQ